jgi:hypothetical protein
MQRPAINYTSYKAQRLSYTFNEHYLRGKLLSRPLWMDTLNAFPPMAAPTMIRAHDTTRFQDLLASTSTTSTQTHAAKESAKKRDSMLTEYCWSLGTRKWKRLRNPSREVQLKKYVKEAETMFNFPMDIHFPEDRLRARFYADHPLEVSRPRVFGEPAPSPGSGTPSKSTSERAMELFDRMGNSERQVNQQVNEPILKDGEDVVRYQMQLMDESKLSEDEAYKKACDAFYTQQSQLELEAQAAAERARQLGASHLKVDLSTEVDGAKEGLTVTAEVKPISTPAFDAWTKLENEALAQGIEKKVQRERARQVGTRRAAV